MRCEEFPLLSMAFLDNEMCGGERARFEEHLRSCPSCREELEKLRGVKEVTTRMRLSGLEDREWDLYWTNIYNRLERGTGWILLSLGATIVIVYALFTALSGLFMDESLPLIVRAGIGCALLGIVILFVSVARRRFLSWKRDPYREVKR